MPVIDHFSLLAPIYERLIPLREPEKFIRIAALLVNGVILDAGGGTGRVAKAVKQYAQNTIVADLSLGMLRQIVPDFGLGAVNSQTEWLPFESETFEREIMIDALHHVIDHQQTADELWRVLKPGVRWIIGEPDVRKLIVKFVALGEKLALMRSHFIDPTAIAALFKDRAAQVKINQDGFNTWVVVDRLKT